jgi:hypothetical protein
VEALISHTLQTRRTPYGFFAEAETRRLIFSTSAMENPALDLLNAVLFPHP